MAYTIVNFRMYLLGISPSLLPELQAECSLLSSYLTLQSSIFKLRRFKKGKFSPLNLLKLLYLIKCILFWLCFFQYMLSAVSQLIPQAHALPSRQKYKQLFLPHFHLDLIINSLAYSLNSHAPTYPTPLSYLNEVTSCKLCHIIWLNVLCDFPIPLRTDSNSLPKINNLC